MQLNAEELNVCAYECLSEDLYTRSSWFVKIPILIFKRLHQNLSGGPTGGA